MCCAIASIPPPERFTPDTLLRLEIAAVGRLDERGRAGARSGSVWAKLGNSWRNGAVIKQVLP
jgi:hypothetical protein